MIQTEDSISGKKYKISFYDDLVNEKGFVNNVNDNQNENKLFRISEIYTDELNEDLYNKFNLILFTFETNFKVEKNSTLNKDISIYFKKILNKAKFNKICFKYAFPHHSELYLLYRNEKRFENPLVKNIPFIKNNIIESKYSLSKSYIEYCLLVYNELKNPSMFFEYDSNKEFINYKRFELFKQSYFKLNKNYKDKKKVNTNLKKDLQELDLKYLIETDKNNSLKTEIENKKTASQKYTKEDFELYAELYPENGFSWKVAFSNLQKITTNEDIKTAKSYNSFDTAFKKKYPEYKR